MSDPIPAAAPASASPPHGAPVTPPGWVVVTGLVVLGIATTWWLWGYEVDDAYIYYRYAQNLVDGDGAVFNLGQRVDALASPLQLLLLLPGAWLGVLPAWGHLLTGTTCLALALAAWRLLARRGAPLAGILAATLLVSHLPLQQAVGMEMPLLILLLLVCAQLARRPVALAVLLALLPLVRPEAALITLGGAGWLGWRAWRDPDPRSRRRALLGLASIPVLVVLGFLPLQLYYGSPVPNSLAAKVAQGASGKFGPAPLILRELGRAWATPAVWPVLLLAGLGLLRASRRPALRGALVPLLGFVGLCLAGWTALGIPPYRWYFLPIEAAVLLLAALGLSWIARTLWHGSPRLPLAMGLAVVLATLPLRPLSPAYRDPELFDQERTEAYQDMGVWLRYHASPGAIVAAGEVGMLGYWSGLYMEDLLGIVTPFDPRLHTRQEVQLQLEALQPAFFVTNHHAPPQRGYVQVLEAHSYVLMRRLVPPPTRPRF